MPPGYYLENYCWTLTSGFHLLKLRLIFFSLKCLAYSWEITQTLFKGKCFQESRTRVNRLYYFLKKGIPSAFPNANIAHYGVWGRNAQKRTRLYENKEVLVFNLIGVSSKIIRVSKSIPHPPSWHNDSSSYNRVKHSGNINTTAVKDTDEEFQNIHYQYWWLW